jgi:F-type H+-transporting ATPase subunit b
VARRYSTFARIGLLSLAGTMLAAFPAAAAEEAEAGGFLGVPMIVWKVANFLVFFGLLAYFLAKPMRGFLRTRREAIAHKLAEAERQKIEALRLQAETEARLAALSAEMQALRDRLAREGVREREELVKQGEGEAARIISQVEAETDRRVAAARQVLAADAAQLATELARELLARELTPEDRERIFGTMLDRLQNSKGGAR